MFKGKLTDRATQHVRLLRFLVVGSVVALVQFSILALTKEHGEAHVAFTLAFAVATATHYTLNRFWALPSGRRDTRQQFGEYLVTVALSYLINIGVFSIAHSILGLGVMWAALCAVPPATVAVFLLLNYRVFRAQA